MLVAMQKKRPGQGKPLMSNSPDFCKKEEVAEEPGPVYAERVMRTYKTIKCPDSSAGNVCPKGPACFHWHKQTERRRDPFQILYSAQQCPAASGCKRGAKCLFAHGQAEELYHPSRYRTKWCKYDKARCEGRHCAFAHADVQLREGTDPAAEALEREYAPPAATTGIRWINGPPHGSREDATTAKSDLPPTAAKIKGCNPAWTAGSTPPHGGVSATRSAWSDGSASVPCGGSGFTIHKTIVPERVLDAGIPDLQRLRRVAMDLGLKFRNGDNMWHFDGNTGEVNSADIKQAVMKIVKDQAKRTSKGLDAELFEFLHTTAAGQEVLLDVRGQNTKVEFSLDPDAETMTAWLGPGAADRERALALVCDRAQGLMRQEVEASATTARVVSGSLEAATKMLREQKIQLETDLLTMTTNLQQAEETLENQRVVSQQRREVLQKTINTLEADLMSERCKAELSVKQKDAQIKRLTEDVASLREDVAILRRVDSDRTYQEHLRAAQAKLTEAEARVQKYKKKLRDKEIEMERTKSDLQAARRSSPGGSTNLSDDDLAKRMADTFLAPMRDISEDSDRKKYCKRLWLTFHPDKNPHPTMSTKVAQELQNHFLWKD